MVEELTQVRAEWQRRVQAEYNSAGITHALLGWLLRLGASPTLLHEATRIVDDELVHAEMAFDVLRAAGGGNISQSALLSPELEPQLSLLGNVCSLGVRVFCLGETVAVRLFKRLREGTTVDVARRALDRVLVDEVRHRDFGWLTLEWLCQQPQWPELQQMVQQRLPTWFGELRRSYGSSQAPFDDALRVWGLMPHADYAAALEETVERDYVPRFADYGIDARTAWRSVANG